MAKVLLSGPVCRGLYGESIMQVELMANILISFLYIPRKFANLWLICANEIWTLFNTLYFGGNNQKYFSINWLIWQMW